MSWSSALSSIGSVVSGLLGVGSSLYGTSVSSDTAKEINEANLAYQREYNQQVFDREDTSYQRAVADAQAAGLSPLVAAGVSAGQSGGVASAPQSDTSQASIQLQGYQGVASAMQQMSQAAAQSSLVRSQANLNNANAEKARVETGDISDQKEFRWAQLTQQQKQHLDNILQQTLDRDQQKELAYLADETQKILSRERMSLDKLIAMDNNDLQRWLAQFNAADRRSILALEATFEQVQARVESALRKDESAYAQELAYAISNRSLTEYFGIYKDGAKELLGDSAAGDAVSGVIDNLAKTASFLERVLKVINPFK